MRFGEPRSLMVTDGVVLDRSTRIQLVSSSLLILQNKTNIICGSIYIFYCGPSKVLKYQVSLINSEVHLNWLFSLSLHHATVIASCDSSCSMIATRLQIINAHTNPSIGGGP